MVEIFGAATALVFLGVSARWTWWRRSTPGLPILMYHKVGTPPVGSRLRKLWVSTDRFREQMGWLKRHGYHPLTLRQAISYQDSKEPLPEKSVVLTFDDGYENNFTHAFPILQEFGFSAVLFLVVNAVGGENFWHDPKNETRLPMVSWDQVKTLHQAGWEIASHTLSHPRLQRLTSPEIRRELFESRRLIADGVGETPVSFAHPYGNGADDPVVAEALRACGYRAACSVHRGKADLTSDPLNLRRIFVRGDDNLWDFSLGLSRGCSRL